MLIDDFLSEVVRMPGFEGLSEETKEAVRGYGQYGREHLDQLPRHTPEPEHNGGLQWLECQHGKRWRPTPKQIAQLKIEYSHVDVWDVFDNLCRQVRTDAQPRMSYRGSGRRLAKWVANASAWGKQKTHTKIKRKTVDNAQGGEYDDICD
jgi:hypothetical protein